jgi:hypothetical protein
MDEESFKTEIARRAVQDPAFRAALLADPKGTVERELGQPLPDSLVIEVVQESVGKMYLVLPLAVAEAESGIPFGGSSRGGELDDAALEQVAGGGAKSSIDYRQDGPLNRALSERHRKQ